jgi:hypothetical protein
MHRDGFNSIQIMISKIISRAACLTELTSNPKSFSNCPDLHGGVPGLPGDRIYIKPALDKEKVVPTAIAVRHQLKFRGGFPACDHGFHE